MRTFFAQMKMQGGLVENSLHCPCSIWEGHTNIRSRLRTRVDPKETGVDRGPKFQGAKTHAYEPRSKLLVFQGDMFGSLRCGRLSEFPLKLTLGWSGFHQIHGPGSLGLRNTCSTWLSCSVAPIIFPIFFGWPTTKMSQAQKRVPILFFPGSLNN